MHPHIIIFLQVHVISYTIEQCQYSFGPVSQQGKSLELIGGEHSV